MKDETKAFLLGLALGWLLMFAIVKNTIPETCPTCDHPIAGKWDCKEP